MGDDEAEPDDKDNAKRDGRCRQPAGKAHAHVQTAHPVRPFPRYKQIVFKIKLSLFSRGYIYI